ncbi:SIR2 family NAD-dependent protein deacylase [Hydrogenimonas sp.]
MRGVMILSGAGLSAESGIPTFRDAGGLWEGYDPMEVCSLQGWERDRALVTRFYDDRRRELEGKRPNAAHRMFARLEERFGERIVHLTQNVDDLLERAGCRRVIHLHGTLRELRCETCRRTWEIGFRPQRSEERCPACGSDAVRHNVVMFGEPAPAYRFIRPAIDASGLFVAVGTSSQVVDAVTIASEFDRSILVDPNRRIYVTSFGSHDRYIDEYFTAYLQMGAVEAAEELERRIVRFLES